MTIRRLPIIAAISVAIFITSPVRAADNSLTIDKAGFTGAEAPIPISLSGFSGDVLSTLRFDLHVMGFKVVPENQADFMLSGKNATRVEGRLKSKVGGGKSIVAKAYSGGSLRLQAHALAAECRLVDD